MTLFSTLLILMFGTLVAATVIHQIQERRRIQRLQKRRLQIQAETLTEIVGCLAQTLPNPQIPKVINDKIERLLRQILMLDRKDAARFEMAIQKVREFSQELINPSQPRYTSYKRDSDTQIVHTKSLLSDALQQLMQLHLEDRLAKADLDQYTQEIEWAQLMVQVMSFMAQAEKATKMNDPLGAQAFQAKAQELLLMSRHSDPRRVQMARELTEIMEGKRAKFSVEV
jgi:hypothetical protein